MITPYKKQDSAMAHGGGIICAAKNSTIPIDQWIDLSTGINPNGWPVPSVPTEVWQRLPECNDGLEEAAQRYYAADNVIATAGSQSAIQLLPQMLSEGVVWVPEEGYAEHAYWWDFYRHDVFFYNPEDIHSLLSETNTLSSLPFDTLLVINPNNPTTEYRAKQEMIDLLAIIERFNKHLVVDEAFLDTQPDQSMIPFSDSESLIVLRSLGKFFGLAGIRCGFLFSHPSLLKRVKQLLGPWHIATPSRWVATQALLDTHWQQDATEQLKKSGLRLQTLLGSNLSTSELITCSRSDYFCSLTFSSKKSMLAIYEKLLSQGILTRKFDKHARLRIGLPKNKAEWRRLTQAVSCI